MLKEKVLFDDGDLKDVVFYKDNKPVVYLHFAEYYSEVDVAVEVGYEADLIDALEHYDIEEIRQGEVVVGLKPFHKKFPQGGGQIGYTKEKLVEPITNTMLREMFEAHLNSLLIAKEKGRHIHRQPIIEEE